MWKRRISGLAVSLALATGVAVGVGAPSALACGATTSTTVPGSCGSGPTWHCVWYKAHWWSSAVCVSRRWY